jgi:hypothetical protein
MQHPTWWNDEERMVEWSGGNVGMMEGWGNQPALPLRTNHLTKADKIAILALC